MDQLEIQNKRKKKIQPNFSKTPKRYKRSEVLKYKKDSYLEYPCELQLLLVQT